MFDDSLTPQDVIRYVVVFVWVLFALFPKVFQKILRIFFPHRPEDDREYPEFPDEREDEQPLDHEEEERKLKEWLEGVFSRPEQQETHAGREDSDYDEYERHDGDVHNRETHTAKRQQQTEPVRPVERAEPGPFHHVKEPPVLLPWTDGTSLVRPSPATVHPKPARTAVTGAVWLRGVKKNSLAYGVVMSEVLARPKALRRPQHGNPNKNVF